LSRLTNLMREDWDKESIWHTCDFTVIPSPC
jgi:hypothetical protein